jgi:capsular exopolysaccharide synthesis family protein
MLQLQLESIVEQVASAQDADLDLTEITSIAEYGSIADILSRKKEIEAEKAELHLRYLEMHPRMIEVEKRLSQVTQQLKVETERAVRDLNNQKATIDRRIEHLVAELQAAEGEALALDQRAVEYNVLKRQLDSDRHTFDSIVNRLNETSLSAKLDVTNLRILDEAIASSSPVSPNKLKIAAASILLFLMGLCGMPLLIETIDNRLKSAYDVESFIGKPLLADLPYIKGLESQEIRPTTVLDDSDESISEGFRSAYSGLQMRSTIGMPKTILITSTRPSEGKSFVASNLVACMGKHGLKCLLVDTDFRRPSLHRHFDLKNDKGIIPWFERFIREDADEEDIEIKGNSLLDIQHIADGFDFLRTGGSTKKTTELIDSLEFEQLMRKLKKEYDVIVLDTPPVSVFTDSLFLSEFADEVVYVAKYNEVSRQKVKHFIHKLDGKHHHKVIGMIINSRTSAKGQRYGYDHNYSYYSSDYKYYKRYVSEQGVDHIVPKKKFRSRRSVAISED